MNRGDILALEAGIEINIIIAEKVMDWSYRPRFDGDVAGYYGPYILEEMPSFSTTWAGAGMVLEKMKLAVGPSVDDGLWYATKLGAGKEGAEATTPQLAICRAALLAL